VTRECFINQQAPDGARWNFHDDVQGALFRVQRVRAWERGGF
jgi:hypothetical protein